MGDGAGDTAGRDRPRGRPRSPREDQGRACETEFLPSANSWGVGETPAAQGCPAVASLGLAAGGQCWPRRTHSHDDSWAGERPQSGPIVVQESVLDAVKAALGRRDEPGVTRTLNPQKSLETITGSTEATRRFQRPSDSTGEQQGTVTRNRLPSRSRAPRRAPPQSTCASPRPRGQASTLREFTLITYYPE